MRIFIGIEISDDIKERIMDVQNIIRDSSLKGRWKNIKNFHLTLKFLGEIPKNQIDSIIENMALDIEMYSHFNVATDGIGFFRGNGCLRVVYLKVDDRYKNLSKLFKLTEDACYLSGIENERRRYTPHITIAQDVVLSKDFMMLKDSAASLGNISIPVSSVNIIKSEQIQGKRVYTSIYRFTLRQ